MEIARVYSHATIGTGDSYDRSKFCCEIQSASSSTNKYMPLNNRGTYLQHHDRLITVKFEQLHRHCWSLASSLTCKPRGHSSHGSTWLLSSQTFSNPAPSPPFADSVVKQHQVRAVYISITNAGKEQRRTVAGTFFTAEDRIAYIPIFLTQSLSK